MAEDSWPSPDHSSGSVNDLEYEQLTGRDSVSGLIGSPATVQPLIFADSSGRLVKARAGRYAKVRGRTWYSGAADVSVTIAANGTSLPRIDLVVLRYDRSTYNVRLAVVQGTPATTPTVPSTTNVVADTGVWELPLARVAVAAGVGSLSASTVTPLAWYLADDGGVLCTSTTRPAVAIVGPGVKMHQTDTSKTYVSAGNSWVLLHEDTGLLLPSMASGWTASTMRYRRVNGLVIVEISCSRSGGNLSAGTDSRLTTLPAGYRPPEEMRTTFTAFASGTSAFTGWIRIFTNGTVVLTDYPTTFATDRFLVAAPVIYVPGG